jgi:hypothetical protein
MERPNFKSQGLSVPLAALHGPVTTYSKTTASGCYRSNPAVLGVLISCGVVVRWFSHPGHDKATKCTTKFTAGIRSNALYRMFTSPVRFLADRSEAAMTPSRLRQTRLREFVFGLIETSHPGTVLYCGSHERNPPTTRMESPPYAITQCRSPDPRGRECPLGLKF